MSKMFGFLYEPSNETEVCILFGLLMPYLSEEFQRLGFPSSEYYIDEFAGSFPDCTLSLDGRELRVEFELYSGNFKEHNHDPEKCDLVVCWKHDWLNCPINVLELSKVTSEIRGKGLNLVLNSQPKHPERYRRWSLEEFKSRLKENLPENDYNEMLKFVDVLRAVEGIEFQTGRGSKIPTLGICFKKLGPMYPIAIEATGKAYIAHYNVNIQPPEPLLPEDKIKEIRNFLGETEKMWHYIEASDTKELVNRLKKIIEIIVK